MRDWRPHPLLRETLRILVLVAVAGGSVACEGAEIAPRLYELRQDGITLYLMGTVHAFLPGEPIEQLPSYVERALTGATVLVLESLPLSEGEQLEYRSVLVGGEGRPSVRDMIAEWDDARRETFLTALADFPANTPSQAASALDYRPYAAQMLVSSLLDQVADIDPASSGVEALLLELAQEQRQDVRGLENLVSVMRGFDAIPQERYLLELEDLLLLRPNEQVASDARRRQLEIYLQRWASGEYVSRSDADILPRELGAPPGSLGYERNDLHDAFMLDGREERWLDTLNELRMEMLSQRDHVTLFVAVGMQHLNPAEGAFVEDLQGDGWELVHEWP